MLVRFCNFLWVTGSHLVRKIRRWRPLSSVVLNAASQSPRTRRIIQRSIRLNTETGILVPLVSRLGLRSTCMPLHKSQPIFYFQPARTISSLLAPIIFQILPSYCLRHLVSAYEGIHASSSNNLSAGRAVVNQQRRSEVGTHAHYQYMLSLAGLAFERRPLYGFKMTTCMAHQQNIWFSHCTSSTLYFTRTGTLVSQALPSAHVFALVLSQCARFRARAWQETSVPGCD